jgi:hypothetical protein
VLLGEKTPERGATAEAHRRAGSLVRFADGRAGAPATGKPGSSKDREEKCDPRHLEDHERRPVRVEGEDRNQERHDEHKPHGEVDPSAPTPPRTEKEEHRLFRARRSCSHAKRSSGSGEDMRAARPGALVAPDTARTVGGSRLGDAHDEADSAREAAAGDA